MKSPNPALHQGAQKLTIVIEAPSFNNIPPAALKALHAFENAIAESPELKLSFIASVDARTEKIKTNHSQSISPEFWDYWPV